MRALLLIVAAVAVAACKPQQAQAPGQAEPCDSRVAERQRWFTTPHEEYDGQKPSDELSVLGSCTDKLVERRRSCNQDKLRDRIGGKPHLHDALALGFKTYVCERIKDQRRTEYPLADVLTERADDRFTVSGTIAKMESFRIDMCKCKLGDTACAEEVQQTMKDYARSLKDREVDPKKTVSRDQEKKMLLTMAGYVVCRNAVLGTSDEQPTIEESIAKMKGFKDDMCRCKAGDKACARKVERAMKDYMDSMMDRGLEMTRSTADDEKRLTGIMTAMTKCQQAAMGTSGAGAP